MKTYKDFKEFLYSPEYFGFKWDYIREEAIKDGFKAWQFYLYKWWYLKNFHFTTLKKTVYKILKYIWYVFVFFGLFAFGWDLHNLIEATTRKNEVVTLSYIARTCTDYPNLCEKLADKGGYRLKKGEQ